MRKFLTAAILVFFTTIAMAQQRPPATVPGAPATTPSANNNKPKPYKEVITDKAITKKGLFTIHKIEDKWYFEIADSMLGREILAVTRYSKTPAGGSNYGGVQSFFTRCDRGKCCY
jgi:hypothetical protein